MCNLKNEKGSVLLAVIIIGVLIAMFSVVTMQSTRHGLRQTSSHRKKVSAHNYAEAGKEHALQRLRDELETPIASSTISIFTNEPFEDGSYSVECLANAAVDTVWITSTGYYKTGSKTIRVTYSISPCDIPFIIEEGELIPSVNFKARVDILAAEFEYSGNCCPIGAKISAGAQEYLPWNDGTDNPDPTTWPGSAPINGDNNRDVFRAGTPLSFNFNDQVFEEGTAINIWARGWDGSVGGTGGDWEGGLRETADSRNACGYQEPETGQVFVLRDGDDLPMIPGAGEQMSIEDVLSADYTYPGENRIKLGENQVIYLMELWCSGPDGHGSYDFQDLVVLVTLESGGAVEEVCYDTAVIFSDDFENGFSGWDTDDIVDGQYTDIPRNGLYSVHLSQDGLIKKVISTVGYTDIEVKFKMGANSLDNSDEKLKAQWKDGSEWHLLKRINNNDPEEDNALHSFEYELPAGAANNPNFKLRFKLSGSGTGDHGYVDDIIVTGVTTVECEEGQQGQQGQGEECTGTEYVPIAWEEL